MCGWNTPDTGTLLSANQGILQQIVQITRPVHWGESNLSQRSFVTTLYPWLLKLRFNQVLVLRWHNHKAATVRLRLWEECLGSDHPPQLASYPGPALVRDPVKTNSLDEEADYTIAIFYYYHHQDDREEMFICQSLMTRYRGYHQSCAGDNLLFSVSLLVTG